MFIILYKKWEEDQQGAIDIRRIRHIQNPDIAEVSPTPRSEYTILERRRPFTTNSPVAFIWSLERKNKLLPKLLRLPESLATST